MTSTYQSNISLDEAVALLHRSHRVAITTHAKPDGDAIGSVLALALVLEKLGKQPTGHLMPPVPGALRQLRGQHLLSDYEKGDPLPEADLYIVLDTGAWSQLAPMRDKLEPHLGRTLVLDHHISGDVDARYMYLDQEAAACCEIVAQLIDKLDAHDPLGTSAVADALFVGIASDTGWFRFSNTRPYTHELAAALLRAGVNHALLHQRLEQTERPERLALLTRALNSLQLLEGGRLAVMSLSAKDFADTGALPEETDRFVDMPQSLVDVEVVALVVEPQGDGADHPVRVSMRSKPGPDAVNVSQVAQQLGGGGHARAAGAKVHGPFNETLSRVIELAGEQLRAGG